MHSITSIITTVVTVSIMTEAGIAERQAWDSRGSFAGTR